MLESDGNGATIGWQADGAPSDVIFDVDFLGQPSGVTTGFVWDTQSNELKNVFVREGDTSFVISVAFAYADNAMDDPGSVGAVWVNKQDTKAELAFNAAASAFVELDFDPTQKQVRSV